MSNTDEKILARFNDLIKDGCEIQKIYDHYMEQKMGLLDNQIDLSRHDFKSSNRRLPDSGHAKFHGWRAKILTLLKSVMDEDSHYVATIEQVTDNSEIKYTNEILCAAKDDYESGFFNLRGRLQIDIFSDLLEQSEQYLDSDEKEHWGIAAVIAGCVLEDNMKKLCEKHEVPTKNRTDMKKMIGQLSNVQNISINKSYFTILKSLVDTRNDAAHSNWGNVTKERVAYMIREVRSFLEKI